MEINYVNGLTALAGGGQSGATKATGALSRFTTVATAGDSALLPGALAGIEVKVLNAGANSMNVYPSSGDAINALGANNAFVVPAGKSALFMCAAQGAWATILSA